MLPFKIITFFKGLSSCLCYELYYFMLPLFLCLSSVPSPGSLCALDCASLSVEWSSRTWGHRLFYGCFSWYSSLLSWSCLSNHCLAVLPETPLGHTQLQSSVAPSAQGRQCLSLFSFSFICHHSTHFLSCTDLGCTLVCPHSVTDNRVYIYYDDFMTDDVKCLKEGGLFWFFTNTPRPSRTCACVPFRCTAWQVQCSAGWYSLKSMITCHFPSLLLREKPWIRFRDLWALHNSYSYFWLAVDQTRKRLLMW